MDILRHYLQLSVSFHSVLFKRSQLFGHLHEVITCESDIFEKCPLLVKGHIIQLLKSWDESSKVSQSGDSVWQMQTFHPQIHQQNMEESATNLWQGKGKRMHEWSFKKRKKNELCSIHDIVPLQMPRKLKTLSLFPILLDMIVDSRICNSESYFFTGGVLVMKSLAM